MINTKNSIIGVVKVTLADENGIEISSQHYNAVTNYTKTTFTKWLNGVLTTTVIAPTLIAAGNGSPPSGQTGASASDTALWSEIATTRKTCDTISVSNVYYGQFNLAYQTTDPSGYYNELGIFDSNGNMWAHVQINQFKAANQTLTVQWTIFMQNDPSNQTSMVTTYTRIAFASWLTGVSNVQGVSGAIVAPNKIQLGTGTGTLAQTDTTLWNAYAGTLRTCDMILYNSSFAAQYAVTYQKTDPSANFTEVGLLDASSNLWVHGVISANKTASLLLSEVVQIRLN